MVLWECNACHVANPSHAKFCEGCGEARSFQIMPVEGQVPDAVSEPTPCPIDGGPLIMQGALKGFCVRMGGYPFTMACPFACPLCGQKFDWTGGCASCHGTTTGRREDWTFPGDGYYTHDAGGKPIGDGQHYVKQQGPCKAWSRTMNLEGAKILRGVLGGTLPSGVGVERLAKTGEKAP